MRDERERNKEKGGVTAVGKPATIQSRKHASDITSVVMLTFTLRNMKKLTIINLVNHSHISVNKTYVTLYNL